MYVESDFILALIKDDDWLGEKAEEIYLREKNDLWTSRYTLIELMMVAYRDDLNVSRVVSEVIELVDIRGDHSEIEAAALYIQDEGFTPFDALHLVASGDDKIISSDSKYEKFSETETLRPDKE